MRPVTDQFLATVRGSHQMAAQAKLVAPGQTGVDPIGIEIPIIAGDVKLDSTADIRGSLDLTTYDADWTGALDDALTPYGNEIFVRRGITYGNGSTEWVSQGYYRIYSVQQQTAPKGVLTIAAKDRMSGIVDAKPLAPEQFGSGASVASVFNFLVDEVYPGAVVVYDFDAGNTFFSSSHIVDSDRYAFLKDIADSLGKVMYWDYAGRLQVITAPNPADPVFTVSHGEGGVVTKVTKTLSRDNVFNAVVATGEQVGENPPVRGVALDLNPKSPTYWSGTFGQVPTFYSSSMLTTNDQCTTAAAAMLVRTLGVPYSADFESVPNVALEPLDPVRLTYSDKQPEGEIHVLQSMTIPLDSGAVMSATTRQQILGGITG